MPQQVAVAMEASEGSSAAPGCSRCWEFDAGEGDSDALDEGLTGSAVGRSCHVPGALRNISNWTLQVA